VGLKIYRHENITKYLPMTNYGNNSQHLYGRNYLTINRVHNIKLQLAEAVQKETPEKL
jgi:hypothetical protein